MKETCCLTGPVERTRLLWLICFIIAMTVVLMQFSPPISFTVLIFGYGLFFISLRIFARFHHKRDYQPVRMDNKALNTFCPKVLIVIPAHNEAPVIAKTVKGFLQLDYPDYELLVVDDRSTDGTAESLQDLQDSLKGRFQFYSRSSGSTPGKSATINDALLHTQGDIVAIFDADASVEPDFLMKLIPYFEETSIGAVQARKVLLNAEENILTRCQKYEYLMDAYFQVGRDTICGAVELRGNGMLIRREALQALGGLNEQCLAEDLDLSTRMHIAGWDIRYAPLVKVWEEGLPFLGPVMRQRIRWTEGSLIRYLENAQNILFNRQVAFRAKLDMMQFVFEFVAPVWLILENLLLVLKWMTGHMLVPPTFFASAALLVLTAYFIFATYQGASRFDQGSIPASMRGAVMVYLYFSLLWPLIVFYLLVRILRQRERNLKWDKTQRYGVATQ